MVHRMFWFGGLILPLKGGIFFFKKKSIVLYIESLETARNSTRAKCFESLAKTAFLLQISKLLACVFSSMYVLYNTKYLYYLFHPVLVY